MNWLTLISYFFGGMFLANALPHVISGVTGRAFQTPFATPHGIGLSSSTVNVVWGLFNLAVAYLLLLRVGHFQVRSTIDILPPALGMVISTVFSARHFGQFHGGATQGV